MRCFSYLLRLLSRYRMKTINALQTNFVINWVIELSLTTEQQSILSRHLSDRENDRITSIRVPTIKVDGSEGEPESRSLAINLDFGFPMDEQRRTKRLAKHRDQCTHRQWEDDTDRTNPLLYRKNQFDPRCSWKGWRWGENGQHGIGTRKGYYDSVGRDILSVDRFTHQHHRQ